MHRLDVPTRVALMRLGIRQRVADEYRRLLLAGVSPAAAVILARGPRPGVAARPRAPGGRA